MTPKTPKPMYYTSIVGQMVEKLKLLKKNPFVKLKMAAILNLRVNYRSNPKNNLKYKILDPKNPENHVIHILL